MSVDHMLTVLEWPEEYKESFIKDYGTPARLRAATDATYEKLLANQKIPEAFVQEARILKRWLAEWWSRPKSERAPISICFDEYEWHDACLLYTSPSPRDLSTSRMPSSA